MSEKKEKTTFLGLIRAGGFILLLLAIVLGIVLYRRTHKELRQFFIDDLSSRAVGIRVELDKVQLLETQGVRLHGLRFYRARGDLLLSVEEAQIDCDFTLSKLLNGEIKPSRISFRYPTLHLRDIQTFSELKREIKFNVNENERQNTCPIELHNGSVVFKKFSGRPIHSGQGSAEHDLKNVLNKISSKIHLSKSNESNQQDALKNFQTTSQADYVYSGIEAVFLPPCDNSSDLENGSVSDPSEKRSDGSLLDGTVSNRNTANNVSDQFAGDTSALIDGNSSGRITKGASGHRSDCWNFKIRIMNPYVKIGELEGVFSPKKSDWSVSGSITEQEISDRLLAICQPPEEIGKCLREFRGHTTFAFKINSDRISERGFHLDLKGEAFRGNAVIYPFHSAAFAQSGVISSGQEQTDQSLDPKHLFWQITDLYLQFKMTENDLKIERLTGRSGAMTFLSDYYQEDLCRPLNAVFRLQINDMLLKSDNLKDLIWQMPDVYQKVLTQFEFSGTGKLNVALKNENGKWRPKEASLSTGQAQAQWLPFPYPLKNLAGEIRLSADEKLAFCFNTNDENKEIKCQGVFSSLFDHPEGKVDIKARDIPIDGKLLKSIPSNWRQEIIKLNPNGYADIDIILDKPKNQPNQPEKSIAKEICINIKDGSVKDDRFPFPVSGVTGYIHCQNENWTIENFKGVNRSAVIRANGQLANDPKRSDNNRNLSLQLQLDNFPLGEELQNALVRFPQKDLIKDMRLQGKANAQVRIFYPLGTNDFNLEFEARPVPEVTSIKPDIFPYELKNLDGLVVYRKGEIVIENIRGRNGQTAHQAGIHCQFYPDGSWIIDVNSLTVDQVLISHELQSAVPSAVLSFLHDLKLSGYFNFNGSFRFSKGTGNAPLTVVWDSNLILQQNTANFKIPIKNICGSMKVRGMYTEGAPLRVHGELDIDSLCVNNIQMTRMTGPFYYDGKNILFGQTMPHPLELDLYLNPYLREKLMSDPLFQPTGLQNGQRENTGGTAEITRGQLPDPNERNTAGPDRPKIASAASPVPRRKNAFPVDRRIKTEAASELPGRRSVTGVLFGGPTALNGWVSLADHYPYQINLTVQDAVLQDSLRDLAHYSQEAKGNISVHASFQGEADSSASLKSEGQINVYDAALYKMPFILKVMTGLSVNKEEQKAFDTSHINFHAIGHKVSLDEVVLGGRALTLFGNGWLVLEENERYIDLRMNSRLGNIDSQIPVISNVIGSAGDQLAQIRIEGPLSDPTIWTERFPGIKKAWWGIFPDKDPSPDVDGNQSKPFRPIMNGLKKL